MEGIRAKLSELARVNGTSNMVDEVAAYIEANYYQFAVDYEKTSQKDRFSTGKLERRIFMYLAEMCKWNNANNNAKNASVILDELGYHSYQTREKRFRQKVENEKKKKKRRRETRVRGERKANRRVSSKVYTKDDSESFSDSYENTKDYYFPSSKVANCRQNRLLSSRVDNPLHISDTSPFPKTRSQSLKTENPDPLGDHNEVLPVPPNNHIDDKDKMVNELIEINRQELIDDNKQTTRNELSEVIHIDLYEPCIIYAMCYLDQDSTDNDHFRIEEEDIMNPMYSCLLHCHFSIVIVLSDYY